MQELGQDVPPTSTSKSSSSGLFSSQLGKAKPPTPFWEAEKESKAQGNFSPAWVSSALPPAGACGSLALPRQTGKTCSHCWKPKPASAGWTGRSSAKGRSPHPLGDPSRGATPPLTHLPRPGQSLRGPSPGAAPGALGWGWVIQSPTPGCPDSPVALGVTAPHLERPRPHLPHFLVLSHPLLRTLDFGTSCPHSQPRT